MKKTITKAAPPVKKVAKKVTKKAVPVKKVAEVVKEAIPEFTMRDCHFELLCVLNNRVHQVTIPQEYLTHSINSYGKLVLIETPIEGLAFNKVETQK